MSNDRSVKQENQSGGLEFVIEMTPSKPAEKADLSDELILSPTLPEDKSESAELTLEADIIPKAEELTFEGEEDADDNPESHDSSGLVSLFDLLVEIQLSEQHKVRQHSRLRSS